MLFETFVSSVCLHHVHRRVRFNLLCFFAGCSVLVFRGATLSFRLFCLVICVAFLLCPSWFPAVHFSAHTSSLVIPAVSPLWPSFVLLFMISPSSAYLSRCSSGPASSSISQDLRLYFRAGLISDICRVLIVSLENSSIGDLNWILPVASCKTSKGQSSCFGRFSIHTLEFFMSTDLYLCKNTQETAIN